MGRQSAGENIKRMVGDYLVFVKLRARGRLSSIPGVAKSTEAFFVRRGANGQSEQREQGVEVDILILKEDIYSRRNNSIIRFPFEAEATEAELPEVTRKYSISEKLLKSCSPYT